MSIYFRKGKETMIFKYVALSCLLLQGVVTVASENKKIELNRSQENLRSPHNHIRAKSQELTKRIVADNANLPYFDSPSGGGWIQHGHPRNPLAPWSSYRSDCP